MEAIAIVILVLGFLFATLQYPNSMWKFWKWSFIGIFVLLLGGVSFAVVQSSPNVDWWNIAGQATTFGIFVGLGGTLLRFQNLAIRIVGFIIILLTVLALARGFH